MKRLAVGLILLVLCAGVSEAQTVPNWHLVICVWCEGTSRAATSVAWNGDGESCAAEADRISREPRTWARCVGIESVNFNHEAIRSMCKRHAENPILRVKPPEGVEWSVEWCMKDFGE